MLKDSSLEKNLHLVNHSTRKHFIQKLKDKSLPIESLNDYAGLSGKKRKGISTILPNAGESASGVSAT